MTYPVAVLLSGGLDSSTALGMYALHGAYDARVAVSINYGQRHARELESARAIAQHYGVEHVVATLDIPGGLPGSALTDASVRVPHGHYSDPVMAITVVPNRNAIMANIAAGIAITRGAQAIVLGVHAGDHPVYPDCRPAFVDRLREMLAVANDPPIGVLAPFVHEDKAHIVRMAAQHNVPVERTWSCYEGNAVHCGECGTCVERREAFELAGVPDPTIYRAVPVIR